MQATGRVAGLMGILHDHSPDSRPETLMPVHPATILVVDDEEGVRMVISRTLQGAGFAVLEAEHGETALGAVRDFHGPLVLAVVDENMPVMTGSEFVREFGPIRPQVPVLFITGREPVATAEHLLLKPFGPDLLLETVARVLGQARRVERA